jgi:hypothetical protein
MVPATHGVFRGAPKASTALQFSGVTKVLPEVNGAFKVNVAYATIPLAMAVWFTPLVRRRTSPLGRALEETRRLMEEAVEFHIEGMRLHGEVVPEAEILEVA